MKIRDRVEIDPGYVAVTLERLSALGLAPELIGESIERPERTA